jgi:hypothetical protein
MDNNMTPASPANAACPTKNGKGLLAQLVCYLFGGGTPAYKGDGQPMPRACAPSFFGTTPAYKPAPVVTSSSGDASTTVEPAPMSIDEPAPAGTFAAKGPITIVVG